MLGAACGIALMIVLSSRTDARLAERSTGMPQPRPEFKPEEVVSFQLAALRASDADSAGIEDCYSFASPLNRVATGPLPRFTTMVRSAPYRPLSECDDYLVGSAIVQEPQAMVLVTVSNRTGNVSVYRFFLTRQAESSLAGCWMTDAVVRLPLHQSGRGG